MDFGIGKLVIIFYIFLLTLPLAIWKIIDIIVYILTHFYIGMK